jgi:hypothetical protein
MQALKLVPHHALCEKDTGDQGPRKAERDISEIRSWIYKGGWSLGGLLKSFDGKCGILFSFHTCSTVGDSALFVTDQPILTCLPLFLILE